MAVDSTEVNAAASTAVRAGARVTDATQSMVQTETFAEDVAMESLSADGSGLLGGASPASALGSDPAALKALEWVEERTGDDTETVLDYTNIRMYKLLLVDRGPPEKLDTLARHIDKLAYLMRTLTKLTTLDLSQCNLGVHDLAKL